MASIKLTTTAGKASGNVELDDALFGVQPHIPVMHQVVTAQLAARRAGTQSTRTRAEVAGGGAKPWRFMTPLVPLPLLTDVTSTSSPWLSTSAPISWPTS